MPFKPVGVDENNQFPLRIRQKLADTFVTKPDGIRHGQIPIWDANLNTWVAGNTGSGDGTAPTIIDGGSPS